MRKRFYYYTALAFSASFLNFSIASANTEIISDAITGIGEYQVYSSPGSTLSNSSDIAKGLAKTDIAVVNISSTDLEGENLQDVANNLRENSTNFYDTVILVDDGESTDSFTVSSSNLNIQENLTNTLSNNVDNAGESLLTNIDTITETYSTSLEDSGSDGLVVMPDIPFGDIFSTLGFVTLGLAVGIGSYYGGSRGYVHYKNNQVIKKLNEERELFNKEIERLEEESQLSYKINAGLNPQLNKNLENLFNLNFELLVAEKKFNDSQSQENVKFNFSEKIEKVINNYLELQKYYSSSGNDNIHYNSERNKFIVDATNNISHVINLVQSYIRIISAHKISTKNFNYIIDYNSAIDNLIKTQFKQLEFQHTPDLNTEVSLSMLNNLKNESDEMIMKLSDFI